MTGDSGDSGQALLTSAFLFAVAIAIIAIMLNNVIYSNNVAYLGFSDQSQYDDSSIKKMTAEEIYYVYNTTKGDQTQFNTNLSVYTKAVNNITLTKGRYVTIEQDPITPGPLGASQKNVARNELSIYSKSTSKSYVIDTNYVKKVAATSYTGGRNPGNVIVRMGTSNNSLPALTNTILIVEVINSTTLMPEPNVTIRFFGTGYFNGTADVNGVNVPATDDSGKLYCKYNMENPGTYVINASVINGAVKQYSNNVTMVCV